MAKLDANGDGSIGKNEFLAWWQGKNASRDGDADSNVQQALGAMAMAGSSQALQEYIDNARSKHAELSVEIEEEESRKSSLQSTIHRLERRIGEVNDNLELRLKERRDIDTLLLDSERMYRKLMVRMGGGWGAEPRMPGDAADYSIERS